MIPLLKVQPFPFLSITTLRIPTIRKSLFPLFIKANKVILQLSVVLSDSETGDRLDGVLLSVVGGIDHRSNKMIDKTGQIKFPGLVG